jgi:hypothetical protein
MTKYEYEKQLFDCWSCKGEVLFSIKECLDLELEQITYELRNCMLVSQQYWLDRLQQFMLYTVQP